MRNRGRRRSNSAQDSSTQWRPNGPRMPNGQRPQHGNRELIGASAASIQTLYVKAGAYERFGGEIEAVREAGGRVVKAEDADLARMAGSEGRHQGIVAAIREY